MVSDLTLYVLGAGLTIDDYLGSRQITRNT